MMSIGAFVRLTEIVSPPDYPVRANGDWKRFVSTNGFWPPEDYRMLVREYGSGLFAGWLYLIEPFDPARTFKELVDVELRSLNGGQGAPFWPSPGGFLPWGKTTGGDRVGWRTGGRPEDWTTVFWGRDGQVKEYPVSTVEFVLAVVERNLGPSAAPAAAADGNGAAAPPFPHARTATFQPSAG